MRKEARGEGGKNIERERVGSVVHTHARRFLRVFNAETQHRRAVGSDGSSRLL